MTETWRAALQLAPSMLHPATYIRFQAFRKGVMRRQACLAHDRSDVIYGSRLMKRFFGKQPEVVEVATMKGGGHWMEIRTYGPQGRRARVGEAS